jgi:hypothetical protein
VSDEDCAAGLVRVRRAELRDPTNPFFPLVRALLLERLGRDQDAQLAFETAASSSQAVWSDLILLASELEAVAQPKLAERAFEAGYAKMLEHRVRPERLQTILAHVIMNGGLVRKNIAEAIEAGDVERVHTLVSRRWRLFPRLEGGNELWSALATWMGHQDRADLAEIWRQRARGAARGWLNLRSERTFRAVRTSFPIILGLLLALPLLVFVAGVRVVCQRRSRLTPLSLLATLVVPIAAAFGIAAMIAPTLHTGSGPFPDDSFGAPSLVRWLESQPSSPERNEVLDYARAEATAVRQGGWYDGPVPDAETIAAALSPSHTWSEAFDAADRSWLGEHPLGQVDHPFEFGGLFLVPLLLGLLLARFAPRVAGALCAMLPGSARRFSVAAGLLMGLFCAALLAVFDYEGLQSWSVDAERYFGIPNAAPAGPSVWWYVLLVAIPLLHAVVLWRDWKTDRGRA